MRRHSAFGKPDETLSCSSFPDPHRGLGVRCFLLVEGPTCSVETFVEARQLVKDPSFEEHRRRALAELDVALTSNAIDVAITDMIRRFSRVPYCFTIQSCHGHFVSNESGAEIDPSSEAERGSVSSIRYRIAYIALCVQDSAEGRSLLEDLKTLVDIDPDYIQYGSANWFRNRCPNTYVLQVEPSRSACQDAVDVSAEEAKHLAETRDKFFKGLDGVLARREVGWAGLDTSVKG
jgi:hypothetical protein